MECFAKGDDLVLVPIGDINSSTANKVEKEIDDAIKGKTFASIVLDFEKVDYVSSAGLRVLLRLKKNTNKAVRLINVSHEVYDVFEMTGFSDILEVSQAIREIDVTECEIIGQGGNGTVYRLDDDKIVKIYRPEANLDLIKREQEFAKTALVNGLPCVIAYDIVKCGDSYGIVFEMLKSDTLAHAMRDHPEKLDEYLEKYVALAKELHNANVPEGSFTSIKTVLHDKASRLSKWCTPKEQALLDSLIEEMPDSNSLIHGDLHPGNIMIQDGELLLIDMPEVATGAKIWDLAATYRDMISAPTRSPDAIVRSVGMPAELILDVGHRFFKLYTGITDDSQLEVVFKKLGLVYALNVVLVVGSGSPRAVARAPQIMDNLLRGVVIPNEQTLRYILKNGI